MGKKSLLLKWIHTLEALALTLVRDPVFRLSDLLLNLLLDNQVVSQRRCEQSETCFRCSKRTS
jgi:hypothetical protein